MTTWGELKTQRPDLAEDGRRLFYQFGVGLAFLSTVRPDGGPRLHPMCPILCDDRLLALIIPSPKRDDLLRDGRYAMHSFPCEDNEDAFYITGSASRVDDPSLRSRVVRQFVEERKGLVSEADTEGQLLFEFALATALLTRTSRHGDPNPRHTVWKAAA
ncbi:MAG TPA: hypothetical protein VFB34_00475 [Chloroflexota bacterium]|nr:hypothetical protein [Chloroflexota bacterium]